MCACVCVCMSDTVGVAKWVWQCGHSTRDEVH